MGTNFYLVRKLDDTQMVKAMTLLINHDYEEVKETLPQAIHIGKSSAGWQFCFNHNNWKYFHSKPSLEEFLVSGTIYDEYGRSVSPEDFWGKVHSKKEGLNHTTYMERWEEIHPGTPRPYYEHEPQDFEVDGLTFSKWTEFS